jgi:hypothetical protein
MSSDNIISIHKSELNPERIITVKELYSKHEDECVAIYNDILRFINKDKNENWWLKIITNIKTKFEEIEEFNMRAQANKFNL